MFVSYAQNFEDVLLWRALKHVSAGFYIDIGAHDPDIHSVSRAFYEHGWRGVHVEPVPEYVSRIRARRPDERVIQAVVSTGRDPIVFYSIEGTGLSTADATFATQHGNRGFKVQSIPVESVRLEDILNQYSDRPIHWLKIDVEGFESEVIRSWGDAAARPWILVIESTLPNSPVSNYQKWDEDVVALGYRFVYFDGLNRYYLHADHDDLSPAFESGPNLWDDFVVVPGSDFARLSDERTKAAEQRTKASEERETEGAALIAHLEHMRRHETAIANAEIAVQRLRVSKLMIAQEDAELQRDILNRALAGIYASRSWRWSAPIRWLDKQIHVGWSVVVSLVGSVRKVVPANAPLPALQDRLRAFVPSHVTKAGPPRRLPLPAGRRTLYVFVDHTVTCAVNTGVQRVVRGISRALLDIGERVLFVRWDSEKRCCVTINWEERRYLAAWNGPPLQDDDERVYSNEQSTMVPVHERDENNWLICPEVTHMTFDAGKGAATRDLILWARSVGLRSTFVFYDAIPLRRPEFAAIAGIHSEYMRDLRLADSIWPISRWSAVDLQAFWISSEKARAVDSPQVEPLLLPGESGLVSRVLEIGPSEKIILCVGTIEERKNQTALIDAFIDFRNSRPDNGWRLVLVGNLHPAVAARVNECLADDIDLRINLSDEELSDLYRACAFTVFPSLEEGFGLPILESLWFGKPCVCANFGAMAEVAAAGGCLTIDMRDPTAIRSAIERMIEAPELRHSLALEALQRPLTGWREYVGRIVGDIDDVSRLPNLLGTVYYWLDATIQFSGNTGIQRVVRQIARSLMEQGVCLIPVIEDSETGFIAPASPAALDHIEKWNGPLAGDWVQWKTPDPGDLFFMPELLQHFSRDRHKNLVSSAKHAGMKTAVIFYDAIPWKMTDIYPENTSRAHNDYMLALGEYDSVVAISEYSRADLVSFLGAQMNRLQGLDDKIQAVLLPAEFPENSRTRTVGKSKQPLALTIVCVGTVEPRKNHEALIEAFALARSRIERPIKLVIAGSNYAIDPALVARVEAVVATDQTIEWITHADDAVLRQLYADADFSVYPSVEEGFGLPILESLWNGTPCICADFGAMAEVAEGGGCVMVDVRDVDRLADAIVTMANDDDRRISLAHEAVSRPFKTWREYAQELALVIAAPFVTNYDRFTPASADEIAASTAALSLPERPRLSVCISTYNRAEELGAALRNWTRLYPSALEGVEIFVCDNASTDHTANIVAPYLDRPDFRYRSNPVNVGMLGNLRETANNADGEYIWVLGDGDFIMPGAIERVLEAIASNDKPALIYLNYAYSAIDDKRTVSDFDGFFASATPIAHPTVDEVGPIRTICAHNENFFTAIYTLVLRRDHAIGAYTQDTSGRPFSTMLTCIPTTYYVLNHMMDEMGVWLGAPQLVVNLNVSWMKYAPLWILERIPEVYEVAERKGVPADQMDRWRRHTLPGVVTFFRQLFASDSLGNAAYVDPARLVRRFKHLPEFAGYLDELVAIYYAAHLEGCGGAEAPLDKVFPGAKPPQLYGVPFGDSDLPYVKTIASLYRHHLQRSPDTAGLKHLLSQLRLGVLDIDQMRDVIAYSAEARNLVKLNAPTLDAA